VGGRGVTFAIRSERAGTEAFLREVATAIHAANPGLALARVRTLNDVYKRSIARTSLALILLGIAGAMALTLAIVGVYGVVAYAMDSGGARSASGVPWVPSPECSNGCLSAKV
jgi:hypothetical protein